MFAAGCAICGADLEAHRRVATTTRRRPVRLPSPRGSGSGIALGLAALALVGYVLLHGPAGVRSPPAPPAPPRALGPCGAASSVPTARTTGEAAAATLCLLNLARAQAGVPALREDPALDRAALAHARDMVRAHYFSHAGRDGSRPAERIAAAGYRDARMTGENLAWGQAQQGAPIEIVAGWLRSPGHRRNILRAGFREIGVGIVAAPVGTRALGTGATYDTTFGAPRPQTER